MSSSSLEDLNAQMQVWVWEVGNKRLDRTTPERVWQRWKRSSRASWPSRTGRIHNSDEEVRKVARDAYVSWQGSRYSLPWQYGGREVWVGERSEEVEVRHGADCISRHAGAQQQHQVLTQADHHAAIPLGGRRRDSKILVHLRETAPGVEVRPLAAYESLAAGGGR